MAGKKKGRDIAHCFVVRRSQSGLGLFAARGFKRGDFVIEYTGALLEPRRQTAGEAGISFG